MLKPKNVNWSVLLGAAFLMATSSIGPGFLTQTTVYTQSLLADFGFVILFTVILDIGAQLNVWRIIGISGKRGQDVANLVLPGLGYVVAFLIVIGGLAFNIGNIAGAGLGMQVLFGLDPKIGAVISAVIGIAIFVVKEAGKAMDKFAQIAGVAMILLTLYVRRSHRMDKHWPIRLCRTKSTLKPSLRLLAVLLAVILPLPAAIAC